MSDLVIIRFIMPLALLLSGLPVLAGTPAAGARITTPSKTLTVTTGDKVSFKGSTDGGTDFEWDFGDASGVDKKGLSATHVFRAPGLFTVTFKASGKKCSTSTATVNVVVHMGSGLSSSSQGLRAGTAQKAEVSVQNTATTSGCSVLFNTPYGVARGPQGELYIADTANHVIRKLSPSGQTSLFAGIPENSGWADGPAATAKFLFPVGLAVDASGNVYVGEWQRTIRKITPAGVVSTLAGQPQSPGAAVDGVGQNALLTGPNGLALAPDGNLYFADRGAIRSLNLSTLRVTTLAGVGNQLYTCVDGTGTAARFGWAMGLTWGNDGALYVADYMAYRIRKVTTSGVVTTLPTPNSSLLSPCGIVSDVQGNLWVTAFRGLFRVSPQMSVVAVAGGGNNYGCVDGRGSAAKFGTPYLLTTDGAGTFWTVDPLFHVVRQITSGGVTTTLAGVPEISGYQECGGQVLGITQQPASTTVTAGQTATFTVVASGDPAPSYQWQKNGTNIPGATYPNYTTPATTLVDSGNKYTVTVSNTSGSMISSEATLTVKSALVAPAFPVQPSNAVVNAGQTASFYIQVTGTPAPTLQWLKDGQPIPGATDSNYTTPPTTSADHGARFSVRATNAAGTTTSNAGLLTVNAPLTVTPAGACVPVRGQASFSANVVGLENQAVNWSVQEGAAGGTVSSTGIYTAPARQGTYHLVVTSVADPSRTATITIQVIPQSCVQNN